MASSGGREIPNTIVRAREIIPATHPLTIIETKGSLPETCRLILLSRPQNRQARRMPRAPTDMPVSPSVSRLNRRHELVITSIAIQILRPTASWKNNAARTAVATGSKFRSRAPVEAGVRIMEYIRVIGARTPPKMAIPAR